MIVVKFKGKMVDEMTREELLVVVEHLGGIIMEERTELNRLGGARMAALTEALNYFHSLREK